MTAANVLASGTASEQTIVGSAQPLALGQDGAPPEWVRLLPSGTYRLNDGRGPYHNSAPDQVIANTRAYLAGREANADYDHAMESALMGHPERTLPFCLKHYRLLDSTDKILHECTDNHHATNTITLPTPITTKQLKLQLLAPQSPAALLSLMSIRCYTSPNPD